MVVVDPGVVPINSRGEKQRMHLRDGFLSDLLDPIYVAYNMWGNEIRLLAVFEYVKVYDVSCDWLTWNEQPNYKLVHAIVTFLS